MQMFHSIQVFFSDWGHSINTHQFNCRVTVCLLLCLDGTFWPTWPLCTLYNTGLCCGTIWEAGNTCSWCIFCPETSYQVWRTQHIPLVLIQNSVIFKLFSLEGGKVKSSRHLSWRFFQQAYCDNYKCLRRSFYRKVTDNDITNTLRSLERDIWFCPSCFLH